MIPIRGLRAPVQIAQAPSAPHSSAARIGEARCRWTADMDGELRRLWRAGQPGSVIAETLRVSRSAVMGRASRLGLDRSVGGTPQQEHAAQRAGRIFSVLKQVAEQGDVCPTNDVLAERFGCGPTTIANALNFLKDNGMILIARGNNHRVVTIRATGQKTAGNVRKRHWSARAA